MKRYELRTPDGVNGWVKTDAEIPTPGHGQILVRVKAVSLNYRDLILAQNPKQRMPIVPVSDGAGEVAAVGAGVTEFAAGDRVTGTFFQNWEDGATRADIHDAALGGSIDGMLSEYVVLSQYGAVKTPDYLSDEEAATLPCAAVTLWNALFEQSRLLPGETVLLQGTGGVSIFGLQFAKAVGARVILTSSSDAKLEKGRSLGADETINYREIPDWDNAAWDLTGKRGVDHVVEVGGAGTLEKSLRAVRYGGTISQIGVLTGFAGNINPNPILLKSLKVQGIYVGSRAMFQRMNAALTQLEIHPVIDRVFGFDEANAALAHLQSGSHFGKIVIRID